MIKKELSQHIDFHLRFKMCFLSKYRRDGTQNIDYFEKIQNMDYFETIKEILDNLKKKIVEKCCFCAEKNVWLLSYICTYFPIFFLSIL